MTVTYSRVNFIGPEVHAVDPGEAFMRLFKPDFTKMVVGLFVSDRSKQLLGGVLYPVGPTSCLIIYDIREMEPLYWFGVANDTSETVLISSDPARCREAEQAAQKGHPVDGQASLVRLVSSEDTLS